MFMDISCIRTLSFLFLDCDCVLFPSLSLFLSLSLSLSDRLQMAPKHKSTPAQNPFGSGSSSSDLSVPTLHIRFCDGKAQQDFLENFQRRGAHPEHHVILSDFSDTPLPNVIWTQR